MYPNGKSQDYTTVCAWLHVQENKMGGLIKQKPGLLTDPDLHYWPRQGCNVHKGKI